MIVVLHFYSMRGEHVISIDIFFNLVIDFEVFRFLVRNMNKPCRPNSMFSYRNCKNHK